MGTSSGFAPARPLWQALAECNAARLNCRAALDAGTAHDESDAERLEMWEAEHGRRIEAACRDLLPSGSGFDSGTKFDGDASTAARLVFLTSFHHMTEAGFYDGWTDHKVTLRPAFGSPDMAVSGRDRNGIKEYIGQAFFESFRVPVRYGSPVPGTAGQPIPAFNLQAVPLWKAGDDSTFPTEDAAKLYAAAVFQRSGVVLGIWRD